MIAVSHDTDLALLKVLDSRCFEGIEPASAAGETPAQRASSPLFRDFKDAAFTFLRTILRFFEKLLV